MAAASRPWKARESSISGKPHLRVAVAGCGAFGRNHLRVYRELEQAGTGVQLVAALEPDAGRAAEVKAQYGIPVFLSVDELLRSDLTIDAASVAVPTVHHYGVASALLQAGLDLLVEKPLAASLAEADDLIALSEKHSRILQPGHLERFNPAVLAAEASLRRPMFFEAHRLSIFTPRSLDVDVVLDLMIHDLDIVLTFAKSPVREVRAVGLPILSPKVDIANVRVEFESGCVANFTASRVSTERVRKLRYFEPRQYVSIDYARRDLLMIRMDSHLAEMVRNLPPEIAAALDAGKVDPALVEKIAAGASASVSPSPNPGLNFVKPEVAAGEPLRLEIESFLNSVRTRQQPHVTARQGRDALALALEIQSTMAAHAHHAGLGTFFETA
ncbi:Gfo/Idh/MocA family protein [Terracidiphilus sp.]|uniref:Gfo/Idh/MocA family protein n=1 Tax=Terracidiphilus sp. TaxID=1964191 RepID=UPI003C170FA7